jgi:DNA polymerase-3 subunit beta
MKIKVNRKDILRTLKTASSGLSSKNMLAILNNVLIETVADRIRVTATDLDKRITASFPCEVIEAGKTTLPGKKLSAVIDAMSGDEISISVDDTHHAEIVCGKSLVKMPGIAPADFPDGPIADFTNSLSVDMADLKQAVKSTSYAVATDNSRIVLTGVLLQIEGNTVNLVGTDGKRLSVAEIPQLVDHEQNFQVILPVHALNFISSLNTDKVLMFFGNNKFFCQIGDVTYSCKTIEGNFPAWRNIMPRSFSHEVQIPAQLLLQKLALFNIVSADQLSVTLTMDAEKLMLECSHASNGSAVDEMEISGSGFTEKVKFMFNPLFLVAAIQASGSDVFTLKFNDQTNPVLFDFGTSQAVIMPIRMK